MIAQESTYEKQAAEFLTKHGITFETKLIGIDCPMFCQDKGKHQEDVGKFPRKTHIHGSHYLVTFKRTGIRADGQLAKQHGRAFDIDFWNSYMDSEYTWLIDFHNHRGSRSLPINVYNAHGLGKYYDRIMIPLKKKQPTAYDVLACLQKSDCGTFEDFCGESGYDSDSRKAEQTYRAVCDEWRKVSQFFTSEEVAELQEIS